MLRKSTLGGDVVLFDVGEKARMLRPPSQKLLGSVTRPRDIARDHGAKKRTEVGGGLFMGNADHGHLQAAADGAGNVTEGHARIADTVKPGDRPGASTAMRYSRAASRRWTAGQRFVPSPI